MEQERQDFEEELENQSERMKKLKMKIESSTHSEVKVYEEENDALKKQLENEKQRISQLEDELKRVKEPQEDEGKTGFLVILFEKQSLFN